MGQSPVRCIGGSGSSIDSLLQDTLKLGSQDGRAITGQALASSLLKL